MTGAVEAELKLTADDDAPLESLAAATVLGRAALGPARTVSELDVYLDTADGRLAAARWACRLRARDGRRWISLKGPAKHSAGDPMHRRPEIDGPVGGDAERPAAWPDSPARAKVLELAGSEAATLVERVALAQQRTERSVSLGGAIVGTLSLDRVEVRHRGAALGTLRVVELEFAGDDPPALGDELLAALLAHGGLRPEPASKLEQALCLVAAPA